MNRLIAIGFLGMAGVIIFLLLRNQYLNSQLDSAVGYKDLYHQKVKENKVWKDELNHWRNKAPVAEVSKGTIKEEVKNGNPEFIKLRNENKDLRKNLSNLSSKIDIQTQSFEKIAGKLRDTLRLIINGKDTTKIQEKVMNYENEWSLYRITVDPKYDSARVDREGKEAFDIIMYWNRENKKGKKTIWPLGKINYKSEITSLNPETKVVKQNSLIVKKKR